MADHHQRVQTWFGLAGIVTAATAVCVAIGLYQESMQSPSGELWANGWLRAALVLLGVAILAALAGIVVLVRGRGSGRASAPSTGIHVDPSAKGHQSDRVHMEGFDRGVVDQGQNSRFRNLWIFRRRPPQEGEE